MRIVFGIIKDTGVCCTQVNTRCVVTSNTRKEYDSTALVTTCLITLPQQRPITNQYNKKTAFYKTVFNVIQKDCLLISHQICQAS